MHQNGFKSCLARGLADSCVVVGVGCPCSGVVVGVVVGACNMSMGFQLKPFANAPNSQNEPAWICKVPAIAAQKHNRKRT